MRFRTICALLYGLLALAGMGVAQSSKQPREAKPSFAIIISTQHKEVAVGTPLLVRATMTNTSAHVIGGGTSMGTAMHIMIFDSEGKEVPEAPELSKKQAKEPGLMPRTGTIFTAAVKPGRPYTEIFDVTEDYDLSRPGKYTIQAQKWDGFSKSRVKSNTITLTVTP